MLCYRCGSDHVIHNGHTSNGDQRFLCKNCGRSFQIRADRYMGYEENHSTKTVKNLREPKAAPKKPTQCVSSKNSIVAIILLLFNIFGIAGLHRFYVGKKATGILYLLTFGVFGLGSLYDLIMLVQGKFQDSDRNILERPHITH